MSDRSWRRLRLKKVGQWMSDGAYERMVPVSGVAVWSWPCALHTGKSSASALYYATKPRSAQPWSLTWSRTEAQAAPRAKNHFLAVHSHELCTPLTPGLLLTEDLSTLENVPGEIREALDIIKRNIKLEARLIDDLLQMTRFAQA